MRPKIQFSSIRHRLTTWFLLVALVPLVIVIVVMYHQRVHSIKEEAFDKLRAIRDLKVNEVNAWLDERTGDIQTISEDPQIRDLEKVFKRRTYSQDNIQIFRVTREHLSHCLKNHRDYHEIFIINPISGIIEISTDTSHEGEDKSKDPYFTRPMQSRQPFVNDIYSSKTLNAPSMSFSTPIFCLSHNGAHIAGILVARVDLEHSLYALLLNRTGMGETGETFIVSKDVVALNKLRWYEHAPLRLKMQAKPALRASQGETDITEIEDYRGEKVLAAYTYIPKTRWGFVAKQDLKEIYAPIRSLLWNTLILLVVSAAVVYRIALFLTRNIARPVLEMTKVSRKIQEGDLSARNRLQSADELGFLAETFNTMADSISSQMATIKKTEDQLRRERDSLEDQVQERTLDLQQKLAERKQAEEALRESEERYRDLYDNAPVMYHTIDTKGVVLECNQTEAVMLGYSKEEIIGKPIHAFEIREYQDLAPHALRDAMEKGHVVGQRRFVKKDGTIIDTAFEATAIYDDSGQVVGFRSTVTDISHLKRAEEALRKSEQSFRDLVENSLTGISIMQNNQIVYQNPEHMRLLGPLPESYGVREFEHVHPDDVEKVKGLYQKAMSEENENLDIDFRFYPFGKQSSKPNMRWVQCRANSVQYQGDKAILFNIMDITRGKELEHLVRMQDKMASLGCVAAGIAHEIRNPLTGITTYLYSLEEICNSDTLEPDNLEMMRQIVGQIKVGSSKIESVIRRVMDFSRPGSPEVVLLDINQSLQEAINLSSATLRKAKIKIEKSLAQELPQCYANPNLIEQVVLNLINNAAKAMEDTDGTKIIKITSYAKNSSIVLGISDSGPGMPFETRDKIFDPFFTTRDGMGIGLSIVHRIITDHGGSIYIDTSQWGGAEFRIELPIGKGRNSR